MTSTCWFANIKKGLIVTGRKFFTAIYSLMAILFLLPGDAHAYLDPGTGSIVIQAIVAGFFGALLGVKLFWHKILGFFKRSTNNPEGNDK
jgi:hypothetical protein